MKLALACIQTAEWSRASTLFAEVTARHDVADAWLGLATSALQQGDIAAAAGAMQACLSRHAASATTCSLAAAVAAAAGRPGWCAIDQRGRLLAEAATEIFIDGAAAALRKVPVQVTEGRSITVRRNGAELLGSPIDLVAIRATEGFVESHPDGSVSGWIWHPHDPDRDPMLTIAGARVMRVVARVLRDEADPARPLSRLRRFLVAADDLPTGMLHVTGSDGRALLGSPLDPGLERRSAALRDDTFRPVWVDVAGPPRTAAPPPGPVDVVVPVYRGREQTLACLASVIASVPADSRVHVVDDASPDGALVTALQRLAQSGHIQLLRQPQNRGFPAAANAGLRAAAGRDVVLLNSDTLVPPGWLQALAAAARSAPDIGTACPLSNEATILSYPAPEGGNPMPDLAGTATLMAQANAANGAGTVDIPVGVGSCMFIRQDCLNQVGLLREDLFAQGYGEENDFCLRARQLGWRHVAATGAFVAHAGALSFGAARRHLQARNAAVLGRLHPGYDAMIAAWIARDPLHPARRRMDALRWRAGRSKQGAVVLVTHAGGGGVDEVIAARVCSVQAAGQRSVVLRPDSGSVVLGQGGTPNLRYRMPDEMGALVRMLRAERPHHVELHHMLGHDPALLDLAGELGIPHEVHVHDYAWFCPRIALVPEHSYCGEPPLSGCEACIADHGSNLDEDISVAALVSRSAAVLASAQGVVVPALDVAKRVRRHFPAVGALVRPWEDDAACPPPPVPLAIRRVCVVGGIGVTKGYEVLLACLRDARRRSLALSFSLVGHSMDDERLLDAGPIDIIGRYERGNVDGLIRAQNADIAFLPSIWPETWSFTLGEAWRAGLRALVFDLGAPAERVRSTGWGWVLPLGMPAGAVNDWMLRYAGSRPGGRLAAIHTPSHTVASPSRRNAVI